MRAPAQSTAPMRFQSSFKPFLFTWAVYLVAFEALAIFVFPRIHFTQTTDFRCFYAAGVLARSDPSHLYDPTRQMRLQGDLVGPEIGWLMFIQPPYEALRLAPFSLLSYSSAYLVMIAF